MLCSGLGCDYASGMRIRARTTLETMVEQGTPIGEIAAHIDALRGDAKVDEVRALRGGLVGRLYELSAGTEALTLADVTPDGAPAGATVTFEGRNSLPAFSLFRKRMTRTADGLVFGYNDSPSRFAVGPGYFNISLADDSHRGELVFEYMQPPPFEPQGWPKYRSNARGLSIFVFKDMYDFVRRVARGVMVGSAYQRGVKRDAYFVIVKPS
jgi:hypothetical protein